MILPSIASVPLAPASPAGPAAAHRTFGAALQSAGGAVTAPARPRANPARVALEAVEEARRGLDGALAAARNGRTFTAQELLALQCQAYRYSQVVDVASKVVEQGVQSVKQAVNSQV